MRSRTRSGRISVFWWPTALWFVSGATTVTSPIPSSACLSASRPRNSTPSSLVTRIRGRSDDGVSARRPLPRACGPARAVPPATGSPRSLSRSRRSVRARSRVMSIPSPAGSSVPLRSSVMSARWPGPGRRDRSPPSRPARRCRSRCRARARAGCGPAGRRVPRAGCAARPGDRPVARGAMQELHDERRHDGRDRDPEDRAGDARDPAADEDRAEDDDRVDADRALHDPRLEDVHDHDPAQPHQDERGHDRIRAGGRARR